MRQLGITTVLVTHDLAEAASVCDKVFVMGPRPTHVVGKREVTYGAERDMLSLRETPEFLEVYANLWRDLHKQIIASHTTAGSTTSTSSRRTR